MHKERYHCQSHNGVKERNDEGRKLLGPRQEDVDLVEVVALKNKENECSVEKEEIEFRRSNMERPGPILIPQHSPESYGKEKRNPQDNKVQ